MTVVTGQTLIVSTRTIVTSFARYMTLILNTNLRIDLTNGIPNNTYTLTIIKLLILSIITLQTFSTITRLTIFGTCFA